MKSKAKIIATAHYLPKRVLTNQDLEKMVETSDEWITTRTGMKERRIADAEEYTSDMGYFAAVEALKKANMDPSEIDGILFATLSPDYIFPSCACLVQARLKCENAFAFDLQAACSGYLYALSVAKGFIESGMCKNILLVTSEKISAITDYTDRTTCVLFGDGASAAVISSEREKGLYIHSISLGADGSQPDLLILPGGGVRNPASAKTIEERMHYIKMNGKELFKHAVRRMESAALQSLSLAKLDPSQIAWLIPHQANVRIIDALAKRFEIEKNKIAINVEKVGNTSASSIGIILDELLENGQIQPKDNLLLVAFGAGLTWGALILTNE